MTCFCRCCCFPIVGFSMALENTEGLFCVSGYEEGGNEIIATETIVLRYYWSYCDEVLLELCFRIFIWFWLFVFWLSVLNLFFKFFARRQLCSWSFYFFFIVRPILFHVKILRFFGLDLWRINVRTYWHVILVAWRISGLGGCSWCTFKLLFLMIFDDLFFKKIKWFAQNL